MSIAPTKRSRLFQWAQDKGYRNTFFANAAGNPGVIISGIMEGNWGRAASPAMGLVRNAGAGAAMDKLSAKFSKAAVLPFFMAIPALTNIPMAVTASTVPERIGAMVLIAGYSVKAISSTITYNRMKKADPDNVNKDGIPTKIVKGMSKRVGLDLNRGKRYRYLRRKTRKARNRSLDTIERSGHLMPAILLVRGTMRTWDGILRTDPAAIGGGLAYITGAVSMAMGDMGLRREARQVIEASNQSNAPTHKSGRSP